MALEPISGQNILPASMPVKETELKNHESETVTEENVRRIISKFDDVKLPFSLKIDYDFDENEKRIIVKVIDKNTNQVVNRIPSKSEADLEGRLAGALGVFIDNKS